MVAKKTNSGGGKRIGYVRVSSADQNDARQLDGVVLDKMFHKEASARGAVAFDDNTTFVPPPEDRQAAISAALTSMLDGKDEDDFTADGKPNLRKLKERVGFALTREEADAVFIELTAKA